MLTSNKGQQNNFHFSLSQNIQKILFVILQVSEELIRVAILWHEMWHEGLEEASRLYFGERNVKGMFAVLEPLHAMMERGPQTLKETSFNQVCDFSEVADVFRCSRFFK